MSTTLNYQSFKKFPRKSKYNGYLWNTLLVKTNWRKYKSNIKSLVTPLEKFLSNKQRCQVKFTKTKKQMSMTKPNFLMMMRNTMNKSEISLFSYWVKVNVKWSSINLCSFNFSINLVFKILLYELFLPIKNFHLINITLIKISNESLTLGVRYQHFIIHFTKELTFLIHNDCSPVFTFLVLLCFLFF